MTKTSKELTNDWKAGKLERGLYWVRFKGKIVIAECTVFGNVSKPFEIEIKTGFMIKISKVLAPVPSYDHFVELREKVTELEKKVQVLQSDSLAKKEGEEIVAELTNENNDLRSLLKECKEKIHDEFINQDIVSIDNFHELLTKIDEVLR